jgi:hypothetical protein
VKTVVALLLISLLSAACVRDDERDYCKNHYLFHGEHQQQIGQLSASLSAEGALVVHVELPDNTYADPQAALGLLQNPEAVYALSTERACAPPAVSAEQLDAGLEASYKSDCGIDNRVEQIDVLLFDAITSLEEVEVRISTPAAQKHFAISRQCEAAIFRLKSSGAEQ